MSKNLEYAANALNEGGLTLALYDGKQLISSQERGIKPLVSLYESGESFGDFSAADKVVGRAAAFVYVLLGIKEIFTHIVSEGALEVFSGRGISVKYEKSVANIINRKKTDICPMEKAVMDITTEQAAYRAIVKALESL